MSTHPIIVRTQEGNIVRFPSINSAVPYLNISTPTIRHYAKTGDRILTKIGIVEIRFENTSLYKK